MKHDEARLKALARVEAALVGLQDVLADRECACGGLWSQCQREEGCDWEDTRPATGSLLLTEWAVITAWHDGEREHEPTLRTSAAADFRILGLVTAVMP